MLSWIRNLLGIRKDVVDTNKAKIETLKAELEVDKLEDEASERNLITRATLADVKKYDPKYKRIKRRIREERSVKELALVIPKRPRGLYVPLWLLVTSLLLNLILLVLLVGYLISKA